MMRLLLRVCTQYVCGHAHAIITGAVMARLGVAGSESRGWICYCQCPSLSLTSLAPVAMTQCQGKGDKGGTSLGVPKPVQSHTQHPALVVGWAA